VFSELVNLLKRIPFKIQLDDSIKEIEKIITDANLKERTKQIISEIYERNFTKIKLLEPQKISENDKLMFFVGNLSAKATVPNITGNLKQLKVFSWDIKVVISNTHLSRVLRPEVWLNFEWEDGGKLSFCATLEQFQAIRKSIASILMRIHALECIKQIDL